MKHIKMTDLEKQELKYLEGLQKRLDRPMTQVEFDRLKKLLKIQFQDVTA